MDVVEDELIDMAHNTVPYPAPGVLLELRDITPRVVYGYQPKLSTGRDVLREQLAAWSGVPTDMVLMCDGAEDALVTALHAAAGFDTDVGLPELGWRYYADLAAATGARVVRFGSNPNRDHPEGPRWEVDIPDLLSLVGKVDVVIIPITANPTGEAFPLDRLDEVCAAFTAKGTLVILDDAYFDCGKVRADPTWLPARVRRHPGTLLVRTFSKFWAMAGCRVGFIIGDFPADRDAAIEAARPPLPGIRVSPLPTIYLRLQRYLGRGHPNSRAAIAAMRSPRHYELVRTWMDEDRERFYAALDPIPGVTAWRSQAYFLLIEFFPASMAGQVQQALREAGYLVKRESAFPGTLRVSLGRTEDNAAALSVIRRTCLALTHSPSGRADIAAVAHYGDDCLADTLRAPQ